MITIQEAIDHATDNGVVVSCIRTEGMLERKYFHVIKGERKLKVEHCGGKNWRIIKAGCSPMTQANCITQAIEWLTK